MASAREILAGRAAVEISVRDKLKAGLDGARNRLDRFAASVAATGLSFQTVQSIAATAAGVISSVFTGPADQLQNMTDRTGMSVEMLQALAEAGGDAGATLEDAQGASRAMANFLQGVEQGGEGAAKTLAALGLTAEQAMSGTQDQRFARLSDALAAIEDPARRAALAQDVFGRGAMNLLPVLAGGSGVLSAYQQRLKEIGSLRSAEQVEAADNLGDAFGRLGRRLKDVGFSAIAAIAPVLQKITDAAVGAVEIFNRFVTENQTLAQVLGLVGIGLLAATGAAAVAAGAITALGAAVSLGTTLWGAATTAVGAFGAVLAIVTSPIGIVVGLVAALAASLVALGVTLLLTTETGQAALSSLAESFSALWSRVKQVFGGIFDAIAAGNLRLAGEIALTGLKMAWIAGWGKIRSVTAEVIGAIGAVVMDGIEAIISSFSLLIDASIESYNAIADAFGGDRILMTAEELAGRADNVGKAFSNLGVIVRDETNKELRETGKILDELTAKAEQERKAREDALKAPRIPLAEGGDGIAGGVDKAKHHAEQILRGTATAGGAAFLARGTIAARHDVEMLEETRRMAKAVEELNGKVKPGDMVVGT